MRAAVIIAGAGGGTIEVREAPDPKPGEGQILIQVHASALNRSEIARMHAFQLKGGEAQIPENTGIECSGEAVVTGPGVTRIKTGDRVMCRCNGAHAGFVVVHERAAMPVPSGMSWTDAAAIPNTFVTAHDALTASGALQPGESMLVNAASSGVGVATIQVARALGATPVMGTSGSAAKLERLKPLGLEVCTLTSADLAESVLAATGGKGVDVVIDNVGATVLLETVKAAAYKGRIVQVGRLAASRGEIDLDLLAMKRVRLIGTSFRMRSAEESLQASEAFAATMLPAFSDGRLRPVVDRIFGLNEISKAYDYMETNAQIGKIVISR